MPAHMKVMKTTIVGAHATAVTLTVANIPHHATEDDVIERAVLAAAAYGVSEDSYRVSWHVPTRSNPVGAVVTLDRVQPRLRPALTVERAA